MQWPEAQAKLASIFTDVKLRTHMEALLLREPVSTWEGWLSGDIECCRDRLTSLRSITDASNIVEVQREQGKVIESLVAAMRMSRTMMLKHFTKGRSSTASSASQQKRIRDNFRKALVDSCQAEREGEKIQLEFPDFVVPSVCSCAAHLFPHSAHQEMPEWLGMDNPDVPENGLLVLKCIEAALDSGQIVFLWNESQQQYVFRVLDKSLLKETMAEACQRLRYDFTHLLPADLAHLKWETLQGRALRLQGTHVPAKRCMYFKAQLAVIGATAADYVQPGDVEVPNNASDGDYKETLNRYFDSIGSFEST